MRIQQLAAVVLLSSTGAVQAAPFQLLANGGFETGTLAGWTTSGLGTTGSCPNGLRDWHVAPVSDTGCDPVENPVEGRYAAYVMNDGVAGTNYVLSQNFLVPTWLTGGVLGWSDSTISNYNGELRSLDVDILLGDTLLANVYHYLADPDDIKTAWETRQFNISSLLAANAGKILTLRFTNSVPQTWTGPAGLGLDDVSILGEDPRVVTVPEPASLFLLGLGLCGAALVRRRQST